MPGTHSATDASSGSSKVGSLNEDLGAGEPEEICEQQLIHLNNQIESELVLFVACDLGIFDLCRKPLSANLIAQALGGNTRRHGLKRLLNTCVSLGLLESECSHSPDHVSVENIDPTCLRCLTSDGDSCLYRNSVLAHTYLRSSARYPLTFYATHSARVVLPLYLHLKDAVLSGDTQWHNAFQKPRDQVFENLYDTPEKQLQFLSAMHAHGVLSSPAVIASFNLGKFRHLVDLGGGTGQLACAFLSSTSDTKATIVELQRIIPVLRKFLQAQNDSRSLMKAGRLHIQAGDFFDSNFKTSWSTTFADEDHMPDIVTLGRICHDWDDERCRTILRNVFDILPFGGAVLLAEQVLNGTNSSLVTKCLQDLNMLVQTEGRERTLAEFESLLTSCGFHGVEVRYTGGYLDAIKATKPSMNSGHLSSLEGHN